MGAVMEGAVIQTENLSKVYKRLFRPGTFALNNLTITVPRGSIFGFLGPNGAGKTTTIKILMDLIKATSGKAYVLGRPSSDVEVKGKIGFLPDSPAFSPQLTAREFLNICAKLLRLPSEGRAERIEEVLETVKMAEHAKEKIGSFSRGMLQRIGMAQALVQSPRLLVLDEPTAGVDPLGSRDIRNIIENLKGRGMTVFLCSHLLEQVQEVCDRVGVIFKGLLIAEGSVNELTRDSDKQEILLEHASPELMERLKEMVKEDGRAVWLEDGHPRNSLESVFLKSLLEWKEKHPNPES